jgi:hypothetical protein
MIMNTFEGEWPRASSRSLPENAAEKAENCKLWSGELRPLRAPLDIFELPAGPAPSTLHLLDGRFWLYWSEDVDVVRAPVAGPVGERSYISGAGPPRVTDAALAASTVSAGQAECRILGVPAPETAPRPEINRPGNSSLESRSYVYTYLNEYGEEGSPSPPSRVLDTRADASVRLSGLQAPPELVSGLGSGIVAKRIYRSETASGVSASWRLAAEIDARLLTHVDNRPTADLGEALPSESWYPPPADMAGLIALPGGFLAGFRDKELCFSEPLAPHAWPPEYRLATDEPIVGLGVYGNTVVCATTGHPHLVTGGSPESMSMSRLPSRQPCISKRGLVSTEAGVLYPCPDGLYLIGPKAGVLATRETFTRSEWQALSPDTMLGEVHDGRYFGFYSSAEASGGFVLDKAEAGAGLVFLEMRVHAAYSDTENDSLYLLLDDDPPRVVRFEGGGDRLRYTWRSRARVGAKPVNLAAARILADYPERLSDDQVQEHEQQRQADMSANRTLIDAGRDPNGALAGSTLAAFSLAGDELAQVSEAYEHPAGLDFSLFGDGRERVSREVARAEILRLPAGYTAREWQVELAGDFPVREVALAVSVEELGE